MTLVAFAWHSQQWLYDANEAAPAPLVPASAFHSVALNEGAWTDAPPQQPHGLPALLGGLGAGGGSYPLLEDYTAWRAADGAKFSFCRFPFLYAPAAKAALLALECAARQRSEFSSALFRSLLDGSGGGGMLGLFGGAVGLGAAAPPFTVLRIRRAALLADAARELSGAAGKLHLPLKVVFVGEEGVDEGGVQKEFFNLVARAIFSPDFGMFAPPDGAGRLTWFAQGGLEAASESEYELVGTVLGLALYNGHLLELALPRVAYKMLLGGAPALGDLADAAPELHAGLCALLAHAPAAAVEHELCLTWTAGYQCFGETRTAELAPNGAALAVTGDNREAYVAAYADWFLRTSVERQFAAFAAGFHAVAAAGPPPSALSLLRPEELEALLCGAPDIDFAALEAGAQYGEGLWAGAPTARAFWRVAHALADEDKKRLLAFVTASDRVPIGGLGALPFRLVRNGAGDERLPTAHTCFNTLLLPEYSSEEVLRSRLTLALANAEGFGLR